MREAVKMLTQEQIEFIDHELGVSGAVLEVLSEDDLYDKIYDRACVIEEVETVATIDDGSPLSERGRIAAEIVTLLGNAIGPKSKGGKVKS